MKSFASDFVFLGERNYVHGPTFFEAFRHRVLEVGAIPATTAFSIRFLRVNQMVHTNGTIMVTTHDGTRPDWGKPAVEMSCEAGGRAWYAAFYNRNSRSITQSLPPKERDFVHHVQLSAPFTGEAALRGMRDQSDLFQAVVEANKQVHMMTLTGDPVSVAAKFRFVYCLGYACVPALGSGTGRLNIRSVGMHKAGEFQFSLTTLELHVGNFTESFKLCFASTDMQSRALGSRK